MAILVTRPSPAGEQLVDQLQTCGYRAYHMPLIAFSPGKDLVCLPQALQQLGAGDLVFALSQQAVHYAQLALLSSGLSWPENLSYYAIGHSTAQKLQKVSHQIVEHPQECEISETLLNLSSLKKIKGKQAIILRGNGGRAFLGEQLIQRGATISYYECYCRNTIAYDGKEQSIRWQQIGIDTLVVTSGEMLQQLYTLVPENYRNSWLLHCYLIVVSERLATLAQKLGWHKIRVADNADNGALMRATIN